MLNPDLLPEPCKSQPHSPSKVRNPTRDLSIQIWPRREPHGIRSFCGSSPPLFDTRDDCANIQSLNFEL
jgi:hypothetical protein